MSNAIDRRLWANASAVRKQRRAKVRARRDAYHTLLLRGGEANPKFSQLAHNQTHNRPQPATL